MSTETAARALEVLGIRRSFPVGLGLRRREVLRGIDLELTAGESLGLVGPNGSGKSTLLRIIAGVERPSAGALRVLGGSPSAANVRARVAFLPEDSPFPVELTALATMDLLGALSGLSRKALRPRAVHLLERVGLQDHMKTPLRTYSRGMLRRFGLAQTFLAGPELVLLDEPTAGLDAQGFAALDGLLEEARADGASVLLSSHLPSDLIERCDALALLIDGRVVARGTPQGMLAIEGRTRIEVEDLDDAGLTRLEQWVVQGGGRVISRGSARRPLIELYKEAEGAGHE